MGMRCQKGINREGESGEGGSEKQLRVVLKSSHITLHRPVAGKDEASRCGKHGLQQAG